MGSRYCAINSPLGPRWGQKSLDLRSRDFCPHLEPRGELIAQYRPPMSLRYRNKPREILEYWYALTTKYAYFSEMQSRQIQITNGLINTYPATDNVGGTCKVLWDPGIHLFQLLETDHIVSYFLTIIQVLGFDVAYIRSLTVTGAHHYCFLYQSEFWSWVRPAKTMKFSLLGWCCLIQIYH